MYRNYQQTTVHTILDMPLYLLHAQVKKFITRLMVTSKLMYRIDVSNKLHYANKIKKWQTSYF